MGADMVAKDTIARENVLHQGFVNSGQAVPGKQGAVDVFDYKPRGRSGYFFATEVPKDLLLLHFTEGFFEGDLDTLTKTDNHVSVAFVVGRAGRIYRLFNPKFWSFHLGPGSVCGNEPNSKRAVAIEMSNVGFLKKDGNTMTFLGTPYCTADQTEFYMDNGTNFRGERFFATFTPEQYTALNALVQQIVTDFNINKVAPPAATRLNVFPNNAAASGFKGVASHVNYRPDGKWDIGPAFDWSKIGL